MVGVILVCWDVVLANKMETTIQGLGFSVVDNSHETLNSTRGLCYWCCRLPHQVSKWRSLGGVGFKVRG